MPWSLLLQWAKLGGMFGISIGAVFGIYYLIIKKVRQPGVQASGEIIKMIVICTFSIGALGLLVYLSIMIFVPKKDRSAYEVLSVKDTVDFRKWRPFRSLKELASTHGLSIVERHRNVKIHRIAALNEDFLDRNTTTGLGIRADVPDVVSYQEVERKSGRTTHEYMLTISKEVFDDNSTYLLEYGLFYNGGWMDSKDNWVGKVMQYPTKNYTYTLVFPTPWRTAKVRIQPPGSTINKEIENTTNRDSALIFQWSSNPKETLLPGTRIDVIFDWPPLESGI